MGGGWGGWGGRRGVWRAACCRLEAGARAAWWSIHWCVDATGREGRPRGCRHSPTSIGCGPCWPVLPEAPRPPPPRPPERPLPPRPRPRPDMLHGAGRGTSAGLEPHTAPASPRRRPLPVRAVSPHANMRSAAPQHAQERRCVTSIYSLLRCSSRRALPRARVQHRAISHQIPPRRQTRTCEGNENGLERLTLREPPATSRLVTTK
jgi:hypothetical protein